MSELPHLKILVVNLHSSRNAGDAALLQATVCQLRQAFDRPRITLAINDTHSAHRAGKDTRIIPSFMASFGPVQTGDQRSDWRLGKMVCVLGLSLVVGLWCRATGLVPVWLPRSIRERLVAYDEADLVLSCPGNIFFTMGRWGLPFIISVFTAGYALLLDKPLYVMPQSVGPLKRWWERALVRFLYSRARLVFVREPVSLRLTAELGIAGPHIHLAPDMAFSLSATTAEQPPRTDPIPPVLSDIAPRLGITVINRIVYSVSHQGWERYAKSVAGALSHFLDGSGGSVYFYPQVTGPTSREDDRRMAQYVMSKMTDRSHARLVDIPTSPGLLRALYGQMHLFVATRLHSGIFAASAGVPTVFIGYLHKTKGVVEMLGMEEYMLDIREITEDKLLEKIENLWRKREIIHEALSRRIPHLQKETDQVTKAIAEDYRHYERQRR